MTDMHIPEVPSAGEPYTPAPPLVGLPVEPVPGDWGDYPNADAYPPHSVQTEGSQIEASPIPLIGAVNFGGIVSNSEQITLAAGQAITLGEKGRPKPRTTMIGLYSPDGSFGQTFQLLGDGQQEALGAGAFLPIGAGQPGIMWLPCRRIIVRNNGASDYTLGVFVIQYDY